MSSTLRLRSASSPCLLLLAPLLFACTGDANPAGAGNDAGAAASADAGGDPPVAKFCHQLTRDNAPITLTIEVGGVRLSAKTGSCSSAVGKACTALPSGSASVRILEGSKVHGQTLVEFDPGAQYVFGLGVDEEAGQFVLKRVELQDVACRDLDPTLLYLTGKL